MKAKEIMKLYNITRNTLCTWVKEGKIKVEKTPSGRYMYSENEGFSQIDKVKIKLIKQKKALSELIYKPYNKSTWAMEICYKKNNKKTSCMSHVTDVDIPFEIKSYTDLEIYLKENLEEIKKNELSKPGVAGCSCGRRINFNKPIRVINCSFWMATKGGEEEDFLMEYKVLRVNIKYQTLVNGEWG